jgi:hypothetical protein
MFHRLSHAPGERVARAAAARAGACLPSLLPSDAPTPGCTLTTGTRSDIPLSCSAITSLTARSDRLDPSHRHQHRLPWTAHSQLRDLQVHIDPSPISASQPSSGNKARVRGL